MNNPNQKNALSVIILTFNSQKYLDEVLKSASFADEILILDSGSSDDTRHIVNKYQNAKFISHEWLGFGKMKNYLIAMKSSHKIYNAK